MDPLWGSIPCRIVVFVLKIGEKIVFAAGGESGMDFRQRGF
jgi:hypothetical protein